ncbi:phosphatase PAP2 family protein [Mesobacillus sp. AQ2]|uniref:phosphatase PAP2 family protein n=1 Tax=Bacillaceae TaxID=186817 RepID=UPI0011A64626|nr:MULTISPECIES: phosphatase PAP2 family protein [Bacillaceae]MCM3125047.1 phosphatase PAP2 family protein [Mesobacillus sp. MER 33]MCM3235193.1 phosphatase PAP2 family protein [Mesobacillus sp. MER 48]WHX39879.1 phosphatase PAP2 family protein [Mesobacillus sp. AQ2]
MKFNLQLSIAFFGSLFLFILLSFLVRADYLMAFDRHVISFIQGLESPWLTSIMKFFTYIGTIRFIAVLTILLFILMFYVLRFRLEVLVFLAVVFCTPILNRLLKLFFQRARPDFHRLIEIGGYSFPSGHAMNAFSFYSIMAFLLWRHVQGRIGRMAVILASSFMILSIGVSRVYLGVHYPSDIVGGFLASSLWVAAVIWLFQRYKDRQFYVQRRKEPSA